MTATIEDLRKKAGLSMKDLATATGLSYSDVYAAEKNEGRDVKRNRAKLEQNVKRVREYLTLHLDGKEREVLARRMKSSNLGDLDDDEKRAAAVESMRADFERRMCFAPVGWTKLPDWNGHHTGDMVQVDGVDGPVVFLCHTTTANDHHWVDCYTGDEFRSFREERVH